MVKAGAVWSVPNGSDLHWRSWDGQTVVYHGQSGDTHLLHHIAAEALKRLLHEPATAEALGAAINEALHLEAHPNLAAEINELLSRLNELGLVERADVPKRAITE